LVRIPADGRNAGSASHGPAMTAARLTLLRAIARHGGIRAAARTLGLSPSTVSRQLRHLSEELGLTLTDRVDGKLELTEAGTALLRMEAEQEAAQERMVEAFRRRQAGIREQVAIRLGAFSSAQQFAIVDAVRLLHHVTPFRVHLVSVEPEESLEAVSRGRLDAVTCVTDLPHGRRDALARYPLWRERFVPLGPVDLSLRAKEAELGRALARTPWILPPAGTIWEQFLHGFFRRLKISPKVIGRSNEWLVMQHMAAEFEAATLVPVTSYRRQDPLEIIPVNQALLPTRTIALLTVGNDVWLEALLRAISNVARDAASQFGDDVRLVHDYVPTSESKASADSRQILLAPRS
jgi:molybdate transport repressor ModE-like protein